MSPASRSDERLARRYLKRQRDLIEADILVVANDHWNFDVRGFNPGGNHGSFFRISTHSTLMLAGGSKTDIPHGLVIDEPYDSLSFLPTLLALTGNLRDDNNPVPMLVEQRFSALSRTHRERDFHHATTNKQIALTGENATP